MYRRIFPTIDFANLPKEARTLPPQSAAPPQFQPHEVKPLISMPLPKMSSMMPMKSPPIGIRFD